MKKKGFTLVELLVVIAIIALLMGILMPALARVRQIAFRMVCGTNLSGIGKAMLIYANDYDDEMPRAGGRTSTWAQVLPDFDALTRQLAYNLDGAGAGGTATITSAFYLLVKYAEVTTKSFICKGDSGVTEYSPGNNIDLLALWDFGPATEASSHCSYSYQQPYCTTPLTTSSEPGMAVAADPNPFLDSSVGDATAISARFTAFNFTGGKEVTKMGNAITHQDEGQNVLFLDSHVNFEDKSFVGINEDNIFTRATATEIRKGAQPLSGGMAPLTRQDNMLVLDYGTGTSKGRTCFVPETPVWVDGQMVEISKVVAGQKIGKMDCASSTSASIEDLEEHGAGMNPCYVLTLESGNSIMIIHSHYFMTDSGKWMKVEELAAGMQLQTMNGPMAIKSVVKKAMPYTGNSYNLMLKGSEKYFVGKDGVVALDCSNNIWETLEQARQ